MQTSRAMRGTTAKLDTATTTGTTTTHATTTTTRGSAATTAATTATTVTTAVTTAATSTAVTTTAVTTTAVTTAVTTAARRATPPCIGQDEVTAGSAHAAAATRTNSTNQSEPERTDLARRAGFTKG